MSLHHFIRVSLADTLQRPNRPIAAEIKTGISQDVAVCADIEATCWDRPFTEQQLMETFGDDDIHCLVAWVKLGFGKPKIRVGHTWFKCSTRACKKTDRTKHFTSIITLAVIPPYRRHDIGSQLLQSVIEFGAVKGHEKVICGVSQADWPAHTFFSRNGFTVSKTLNDFTNGHGDRGCYLFEYDPNRRNRSAYNVDLENRFS